MDGMNANTKESRKKFLAPLLVLMLCVVSLTGAAYAYQSSVTVVNNTVTGEEYVLEVYPDLGTDVISTAFTVDALRIFSETTVGGDPNKVVVKAETYSVGDSNVIIGKLTLKDTTVGDGVKTAVRNITLTKDFADKPTEGKYDGVIQASEVGGTGEGSIGYTITLGLFTEDDCAVGHEYNPAVAIEFKNGVATLYYKVTIEATSASATGITFNNNTPQVDVDAVQTQLALEKFILIFTANPAA